MVPDLVMLLAYGGVAMATLDVAGHIWNARKIRALRREVDASVHRADERGGIMLETLGQLAKASNGSMEALGALLGAAGISRDEQGALVVPAPRQPFAHGQADPTEARAQREVYRAQRATAEGTIIAKLGESLGPELGSLVTRYAKANAPDAWKAALRDPDNAPGILGPLLRMGQKWAESSGAGAGARPAGAAGGHASEPPF